MGGYGVFERLGLRHMVVLDTSGKPVGMITRLTLLPWWPSMLGIGHDAHEPADGTAVELEEGNRPFKMAQPKMGTDPSDVVVETNPLPPNDKDEVAPDETKNI